MSDGTTTLDIQACLDRLRHGDNSARDELIAAACERLRRLTHRMLAGYPGVRRWDETDDVLNNALLRLCRALAEVGPQTPRDFLGLAALQIRRELLDLARRHSGPEGMGANLHSAASAELANPSGPRAEPAADSTMDPIKLTAWQEFHQRVEDLPDDEREVFQLLWYQEVSQPAAADLLGVSLATVKRRWQSARRRLFDLLDGELPE